MSEFIYTSPKQLDIPKECLECPAICIINNERRKQDIETEREVGTAFTDDEMKHENRQHILEKFVFSTSASELYEPLEEKRKRLARKLNQQEDDIEGDQVDIDEMTEVCGGPARIEGTTPLGRRVVATVCGSEDYGGASDRFFVGPGHGQAQHEHVHVKRFLDND